MARDITAVVCHDEDRLGRIRRSRIRLLEQSPLPFPFPADHLPVLGQFCLEVAGINEFLRDPQFVFSRARNSSGVEKKDGGRQQNGDTHARRRQPLQRLGHVRCHDPFPFARFGCSTGAVCTIEAFIRP